MGFLQFQIFEIVSYTYPRISTELLKTTFATMLCEDVYKHLFTGISVFVCFLKNLFYTQHRSVLEKNQTHFQ